MNDLSLGEVVEKRCKRKKIKSGLEKDFLREIFFNIKKQINTLLQFICG